MDQWKINELQSWLEKDPNHLFPTRKQKDNLVHKLSLSHIQVENWFTNYRKVCGCTVWYHYYKLSVCCNFFQEKLIESIYYSGIIVSSVVL